MPYQKKASSTEEATLKYLQKIIGSIASVICCCSRREFRLLRADRALLGGRGPFAGPRRPAYRRGTIPKREFSSIGHLYSPVLTIPYLRLSSSQLASRRLPTTPSVFSRSGSSDAGMSSAFGVAVT